MRSTAAFYNQSTRQRQRINGRNQKIFLIKTGVVLVLNTGPQYIQFKVQSIQELKGVVTHFKKYPLKTKKQGDFKLFLKIIDRINRKEHLTLEGLR